MQTYTASGRSRWPWIIGGAVIIIAIVVAIVYGTSHGSTTTADPTTTASPSASPSATATTQPTQGGSDGNDDAAPTGCLGGANRDADMVLAAQKAAPHSAFGAVDLAASFARFAFQYPYPTADQADQVSATLFSSDAPADQRNLSEQYQSATNITSGNVPDGVPFTLSTVSGLWSVAEGSTPDRVIVNLNTNYVIDGIFSPTKTAAIAYQLEWQDNAWHVQGTQSPDVQQLGSGGTRFTGGC